MADSRAQILIVDDEEFNLEILQDFLEDSDYDLSFAHDGLEAINILEANPSKFDTVLLDRMMPNMSGMETLERMRMHPQLVHVPVILQTAAASNQDIVDGLKAGAYYYLPKPFETDLLNTVIESALNERYRYKLLQNDINTNTQMMQSMGSCSFQIKTLEVARTLASFLASACPQPEKVVTGLSELLINSIEHGNLCIGYDQKTVLQKNGSWIQEIENRLEQDDYKDKFTTIQFENTGKKIHIIITDQGAGFEWKKYLEFDPVRVYDSHGRGVAMAKAMSFDSLEYNDLGNQVHALINL